MAYIVTITPSAEKDLAALPVGVRTTIYDLMRDLGDNPRPAGVKKLKGRADTYRVRSGSYRIVYEINDEIRRARIVGIGDRKDVYR